MVTSRLQVEESFVKVLRDSGIPNVALSVENLQRKYPIVVVDMVTENQDHPLLSSDVSVDATAISKISKPEFIPKEHYELVDKVRWELSSQSRIYQKLLGTGLRVGWVYSTVDSGIEVESMEGGPAAISTISVSLSVQ